MKYLYQCAVSVLNIRTAPEGKLIGEIIQGDQMLLDVRQLNTVWSEVEITTGNHAGARGFVRRKWIAQCHAPGTTVAQADRSQVAHIIEERTREFDSVTYGLGAKAKSWHELQDTQKIDCSGWVYLLAQEFIGQSGVGVNSSFLSTTSNDQITAIGKHTGVIFSGVDISEEMFQPGCLIGLDNAEYSWDRNRSLDIDHIVVVGEDSGGKFISQSSSLGGGVNRVPLKKWLNSVAHLRISYRIHLVDPFLPKA